VFPHRAESKEFAGEHATHPPDGAVEAATTRTVIGGSLGLIAGISTLTIPGLGLLMAASRKGAIAYSVGTNSTPF
jgi:hypothetical protein